MNIEERTSAFPVTLTDKQWDEISSKAESMGLSLELGGLTKREYFAAAAMQGIITNSAGDDGQFDDWNYEAIAKYSVVAADELIKSLKK